MEWVESVIGNEKHIILWWQVAVRAFLMFFAALLLVRIAGIRTFRKKSAIDHITVFILGAVLARAIPGASPFFPTILAGLVIVLLHRLLAIISYYHKGFGELVKGRNVLMFANGEFHERTMRRHNITREDIIASVRKCIHCEDLSKVEKVYLEASGEMNIVKKETEGC